MTDERTRLEESLRGWAADTRRLTEQRDLLVAHALELGITKQRIHQLTGIARTTIDRIAGHEAPPYRSEGITGLHWDNLGSGGE